jgi:hypothetical protein
MAGRVYVEQAIFASSRLQVREAQLRAWSLPSAEADTRTSQHHDLRVSVHIFALHAPFCRYIYSRNICWVGPTRKRRGTGTTSAAAESR